MRKYVLKNKLYSCICLLFMVLETAYIFLKVYVIQQTIETAIGNLDWSFTELITQASVVLVFGTVIKYSNRCLQNGLVARLVHALREGIFRGLIFDHGRFASEVGGSFVSSADIILPAMTTELMQVEEDYIRKYLHIIQSTMMLVAVTMFIISIHVVVGIIVFLLSLLPLVSPIIFSKRAQKNQKDYNEANAKYVKSLSDIVNGLETIKSFGVTDEILKSIKSDIILAEMKFAKARTLSYGVASIAHGMLHFIRIAILAMFGFLTLNGIIAVGILIALIEMVDSYLQRADDLIRNVGYTKSIRPILSKILDLSADVFSDDVSNAISEVTEISLNNVSFNYPNVDFTLSITQNFERGKKYLIVGKSGSGKSSILKLLTREKIPKFGKIMVGDVPLQQISSNEWFSQLSIIRQDVFIFNSTLVQNIDINDTGDFDSVESAIEAASLGNFVRSLENGLNSQLGDNASLISGGERQRIAIARAIFKGSKIFLVDEATSSLDNVTSTEIENTLLAHAETLVMVSHRITADIAKKFDQILVIDNGSVVERGKFQELLDKKEHFYDLYHFIASSK